MGFLRLAQNIGFEQPLLSCLPAVGACGGRLFGEQFGMRGVERLNEVGHEPRVFRHPFGIVIGV